MVINVMEIMARKKVTPEKLQPELFNIYKDTIDGYSHYTVYKKSTPESNDIGKYTGEYLEDEMDRLFVRGWEKFIIEGLVS